jgi:hypothetical protein
MRETKAQRQLRIAAQTARWQLHAVLIGQPPRTCKTCDPDETERQNWDLGREVAGETLADLQRALQAVYRDQGLPSICSGCSPIEGFEVRAPDGIAIHVDPRLLEKKDHMEVAA